MVNTLRDIARWVYAWILVFFGTVDAALAHWEKEFIAYATKAERKRLVEKLEKSQDELLEVIEELHDLKARDEYEQAIHG